MDEEKETSVNLVEAKPIDDEFWNDLKDELSALVDKVVKEGEE